MKKPRSGIGTRRGNFAVIHGATPLTATTSLPSSTSRSTPTSRRPLSRYSARAMLAATPTEISSGTLSKATRCTSGAWDGHAWRGHARRPPRRRAQGRGEHRQRGRHPWLWATRISAQTSLLQFL
eukprot:8808888-Pyramimonas_sp.AAC.1